MQTLQSIHKTIQKLIGDAEDPELEGVHLGLTAIATGKPFNSQSPAIDPIPF